MHARLGYLLESLLSINDTYPHPYLAREILKTSCATLLVLYVILLSNSLGRLLADIADGDIPQQALWPVMLAQSIYLLSILLPISLFLGIVFTFGRMYKDHEIVGDASLRNRLR